MSILFTNTIIHGLLHKSGKTDGGFSGHAPWNIVQFTVHLTKIFIERWHELYHGLRIFMQEDGTTDEASSDMLWPF